MNSRYLSIFFLLTLFAMVFAAPVPLPEPESTSEDGVAEIAARDISTLEPRGGARTTWYNPGQGGGRGSCGWKNKDSEFVVALSQKDMKKSMCGKVSVSFWDKKSH
ncbi:hypothetical protein FRC12_017661 [Ceratobasidium sp. 428]|nr:hypothetical protein FRC12_017661 [Ceratobasidium sp. 428]